MTAAHPSQRSLISGVLFGVMSAVLVGVGGTTSYLLLRGEAQTTDIAITVGVLVLGLACAVVSSVTLGSGLRWRSAWITILILFIAGALAWFACTEAPLLLPAATTVRSTAPDGTTVYLAVPISPAADDALRSSQGCDQPRVIEQVTGGWSNDNIVVDGRCFSAAPRLPVDLRAAATRDSPVVGYAFTGSVLHPDCRKSGQRVTNSAGRSDPMWLRVHDGNVTFFIAEIWTHGREYPRCSS